MVDPLLLEVDDELRRERMQKLWQRFGQYVVTLSFAIVLITAAIVGWKSYQDAKNEGWTAQLLTAQQLITDKEPLAAMDILRPLMEQASPEISDLARLWSIQLLTKEGKRDDAKALAESANIQDAHRPYRDIFILYRTVLNAENNNTPTDSQFLGLIQEAQAMSIIKNDPAAAQKLLQSIEASATTSSALQNRAMLISSTIEKE